MNLNHLEYFAAACDTGSISEAAKTVYVSQQSVSAAVAALERELHATLLERSRNGVSPTAEGRRVYEASQEVFNALQMMRDDIAHHRRNVAGSLAFAFIPQAFTSPGPAFKASVFEDFHHQWPKIDLELFEGQSDFCQKAVKEGLVDAALISGITDTGSFRVIPLWECPVVAYVRKDSDLAERSAISFDDLQGHILHSPPGSGYPLWDILWRCRERGFSPEVLTEQAEVGSPDFQSPDANGVCFMLSWLTLEHSDDNFVVVPFVEADRPTVPANIIIKAGSNPTPQAEALIEHLRCRFGELEAALAARATLRGDSPTR